MDAIIAKESAAIMVRCPLDRRDEGSIGWHKDLKGQTAKGSVKEDEGARAEPVHGETEQQDCSKDERAPSLPNSNK